MTMLIKIVALVAFCFAFIEGRNTNTDLLRKIQMLRSNMMNKADSKPVENQKSYPAYERFELKNTEGENVDAAENDLCDVQDNLETILIGLAEAVARYNGETVPPENELPSREDGCSLESVGQVVEYLGNAKDRIVDIFQDLNDVSDVIDDDEDVGDDETDDDEEEDDDDDMEASEDTMPTEAPDNGETVEQLKRELEKELLKRQLDALLKRGYKGRK